jgi:signal transduction histidine kinase
MNHSQVRLGKSPVVRYGVALASVALAFAARLVCDPVLGDRSAQDFFLVAVAASAWFGGAGPSAVSLVASTLVGLWFFVPPRHSLLIADIVDMVETASFLFSGIVIAVLTVRMKMAVARATTSAEEARSEVERRKRIERELQSLNGRLEEEVDRRTSDLRFALRELDAYAYSIAHNLRGPLRGIAGMSELLREEQEDRLSFEGRDQLTRLIEAGRRMDDLILGLLEYSRASRGEFPVETVPLADALDEALHREHDDLDRQHAEVTVEGNLPVIRGHRETIVPVLVQLVSNAAKFVAPGVTPQIRIRAERRDARVRLWVEDNGIGIDPQYHHRVFGMFERLHSQADYPGTGIGLAIVRKCMERMGGAAFVESEAGKGSRFWIEAPAADAA